MSIKRKLQFLKILDERGKLNRGFRSLKFIKSKYPQIHDDIIHKTTFLSPDAKLSERIYCITHNLNEHPKCKFCGTLVKFSSNGRYHQYCSLKCSNKSAEVQLKKQQTSRKHFGTDHPCQSKKVQEKQRRTFQKNLGVDYPFQSTIVQQRMKEKWVEKYGVDNPRKSNKIKQKIASTNIEKYGLSTYAQSLIRKDSLELLQNKQWLQEQHHTHRKSLLEIGEDLKVSATTVANYMKKYQISVRDVFSSIGQKELCSFLDDLGISYISNYRGLIYPKEIDIFIPDYNLAIEYNGLFWHSDIYKNSNYHLQKTQMCELRGFRLIHIFEDEWRDQQQKCKDTIRHLLGKSPPGTFARNAYIKEIPWKQAQDFLNKHHLLGAGSSGSFRIGAFDKRTNELIGVMVFGRSTSEGSNEIELKRFVTNKRNNPGLGSKMFKYAVNTQGYQEVIAFVDRRWFTGLVKDHIGFERIYETKPTVWWTDGKKRYHRRFITKQQLIEKYHFPSNLSKKEMLESANFYRIWDCGKLKLKWTNKK